MFIGGATSLLVVLSQQFFWVQLPASSEFLAIVVGISSSLFEMVVIEIFNVKIKIVRRESVVWQ
ncbi:MAG: hypothetical protein HYW33_00350 [Candidatus Blackburnbacteria bacterium]|nr:hypothetical protein [Candidatus Blackburnbacteria bacterium]